MRTIKQLQKALDRKMEVVKNDFIGFPMTGLSVKKIETTCQQAFNDFVSNDITQEEAKSIPHIRNLAVKAIIHGNDVSIVLILEDL